MVVRVSQSKGKSTVTPICKTYVNIKNNQLNINKFIH